MILDLEVLAQHLHLAMVGHGHIVAVLYHRHVQIVGGFPRSAYSVLFTFLKSRSHEALCEAPSGLAASNNVVSNGEQSTAYSQAAPPLLIVQLPTLLQDQRQPSFHRHRPHLCSIESISPTVQLLDFSAHVILHTGPYARSSERRHEQ